MPVAVDLAQPPIETLISWAARQGDLATHGVLVNAYLRGEHLQAAWRLITLPREIRDDSFGHRCLLQCGGPIHLRQFG